MSTDLGLGSMQNVNVIPHYLPTRSVALLTLCFAAVGCPMLWCVFPTSPRHCAASELGLRTTTGCHVHVVCWPWPMHRQCPPNEANPHQWRGLEVHAATSRCCARAGCRASRDSNSMGDASGIRDTPNDALMRVRRQFRVEPRRRPGQLEGGGLCMIWLQRRQSVSASNS